MKRCLLKERADIGKLKIFPGSHDVGIRFVSGKYVFDTGIGQRKLTDNSLDPWIPLDKAQEPIGLFKRSEVLNDARSGDVVIEKNPLKFVWQKSRPTTIRSGVIQENISAE